MAWLLIWNNKVSLSSDQCYFFWWKKLLIVHRLVLMTDKRVLEFKNLIKLYCPFSTASGLLFPVCSGKEESQPVTTLIHQNTATGFRSPSLMTPYGNAGFSSVYLKQLNCLLDSESCHFAGFLWPAANFVLMMQYIMGHILQSIIKKIIKSTHLSK